jgi:MFS family permease
VVPLEALHLLGTARAVTLLYVGAGLVTVVGRFSIPYLVRLIQKRFVFTLGTLSLAASSYLLGCDQLPALAAGLVLSAFAFACIEIISQLYLLDHIPRQALKHFEPIRIFASAGPWTLGPWLGVYLQRSLAFAAPFAIGAIAAVTLLVLFWTVRLGENVKLAPTRRSLLGPIRYLRRFFAQPRLRLAWTLAAARSAWWALFYVYTRSLPLRQASEPKLADLSCRSAQVGSGWRRFGVGSVVDTGFAGYYKQDMQPRAS